LVARVKELGLDETPPTKPVTVPSLSLSSDSLPVGSAPPATVGSLGEWKEAVTADGKKYLIHEGLLEILSQYCSTPSWNDNCTTILLSYCYKGNKMVTQ
jgi:hypothetical protein